MNGRVVSVGVITSYIRELFDSNDLLADIWIEGEVSDTFLSRAGHVYFTLTDGACQLKCALFRGQAVQQRHLPRAGEQIAAHGSVSIYERDGAYQLYVDSVQPAGIGLLSLEFERLRQQLAAEGLFDPARKRAIPSMPRCIGVVTSAEGSVWHDIQNVLRRRFPLTQVLLAATSVQGERAPLEIVAALDALQRDGRPEVVIVARGGGSVEDLWCFNDERVVRAIFACRIPVVSGIGHETDWTLADEVADLRAPTPSAAAELCSPSVIEIGERISDLRFRLRRSTTDELDGDHGQLANVARRLGRCAPTSAIVGAHERTSLAERRLHVAQRQLLAHSVDGSRRLQLRLTLGSRLRLDIARRQVVHRNATLAALAPAAVLGRGYSILSTEPNGRPLRHARDLAPGDALFARLSVGTVVSRVQQVDESDSARNEIHGGV